MTGSLDRLVEEAIVDLLDAETSSSLQAVPDLLGTQETDAVLPRITVRAESQESPDFQETSDGIYGVYQVMTTVTCLAEATSATSSDDMEELVAAVDEVIDGDLAEDMTSSALKVFGVVMGDIRQEMQGNRLIRQRDLLVWARIPPA